MAVIVVVTAAIATAITIEPSSIIDITNIISFIVSIIAATSMHTITTTDMLGATDTTKRGDTITADTTVPV